MAYLEILLKALKVNGIEVQSNDGKHVKVKDTYDIEVEANGMYKLKDEGYIIAPFDDASKLCRFLLNC